MKLKMESEVDDTTEEVKDNYLYDYQITTPEQCIMQLKFYLEAYKDQKEGADLRLYHIRLKKNVWIVTVAAMVLLCEGLIVLSFNLIKGFSMYGLVAFAMAVAALLKSIEIMIVSIYSYGVHFERPRFERYIKKYNIFTIQDEKNHCDVEILKLKQMIEEVKRKATEAPQIERRYFEYKYVTRYAETKVCHFFDEHSKLVVAVGAIFLLAIFTFVVYVLVHSPKGLTGGIGL
ncbi:MAG: hypothetical protein NC393_05815 [Clostridium sp.]|nr:hypothetical protein [Clostridium sp.]MCM1171630.1 hypothetical protein [Clostridium sp.]MCM1207889.1 hypothetical protein [Ruminococcus sp.]